MLRAHAQDRGTCSRLRVFVSAPMIDQCCSGDLGYLLLQVNVTCLLLALIGTTALVKHPAWFGTVPVVAQSLTER